MLLALIALMDNAAEISCKSAISIGQDDQCVCRVEHVHTQPLLSERDYRQKIYWFNAHNPAFFKLHSIQKDLDYYVTIIKDHIAVLEKKALLNRDEVCDYALRSRAMFSGLFASIFSCVAGYGSYANYKYNGHALQNSEWMIGSIMFGLVAVFGATMAKEQFTKVYRYAERIIERLERDRRILAILEEEKAAKDGKEIQKTVDKVKNVVENWLR